MTPAEAAPAPAAGAGALDAWPVDQANLGWSRALVEGLVAGGVRHAVLSPGSRSSPLAFAVHAERRIRLEVQIDERSAAFLALGIAKATGQPVALVCTSGTAAANYLPAMAEATLAGVPLVALTADRPPELRGTGAAQTIDQLNLFGKHARHFEDLPCPGDRGLELARAARSAREACVTALEGAGGPVHLNVPFREPLVPPPEDLSAFEARWTSEGHTVLAALRAPARVVAQALPDSRVLAAIAERLRGARRPMLIAGPGAVTGEGAGAVLALARTAAMPILADIASGLRDVQAPDSVAFCAHADLFLRDEAMARLAPDFVLRIGGIPTSKVVATWLARHRPPLVAIQSDARRRDPDGIVSEVLVGEAGAACNALAARVSTPDPETKAWNGLLRVAEDGAKAWLAQAPREARAVATACAEIPEGGALFLSSSMPIRWAEMTVTRLAPRTRVFVNRGANGIDGIASSAIGTAIGTGAPTLLVTGDLAFLHDAGGLRAARRLGSPLVVLLLDNDGGGIFSHLPVARHASVFEPLFGTPQGGDLAAVSQAAGVEHRLAHSLDEVRALTRETFARGGARVVQWRTDRGETAREQAALARLPGMHERRVEAGGIAWLVRERGPGIGVPVVLLHGFTGSGAFWTPAANALPRHHCVIPDLPGHGGTAAPQPPESWRLDRAADALAALLDVLGHPRVALAGYSMGGRLALSFALRHPARVAALALIGATPGIDDGVERETRAQADAQLADAIERDGIEAFSRDWEANPLFASQAAIDPRLRESMRAQRLAQHPERLAAALRAFGTGFQPPLQDELPRLRMPVLLMAGELDAKFAAIARDMQGRIMGSRLSIVAGAGHAVPLEQAQAFATELDAFLTSEHPKGDPTPFPRSTEP